MRVIVVPAELSNSFRKGPAEVRQVEHRATLSTSARSFASGEQAPQIWLNRFVFRAVYHLTAQSFFPSPMNAKDICLP
jgi:hypothetical protein